MYLFLLPLLSTLFSPVSFLCFQAYTHFVNVTESATQPVNISMHFFIPLSILNTEPVFSPSCLSFVPPLLPSFVIPGSQPSCNHLPSPSTESSIVSAWFSSLSLSCSMQPCRYCAARAKWAQPPIWAQGRGREALQTAGPARKTRQYWLLSSSTDYKNLNVHQHLLIGFFSAEIHKSSSVSLLICCFLTIPIDIPWFTLSKQQTCSLKGCLYIVVFGCMEPHVQFLQKVYEYIQLIYSFSHLQTEELYYNHCTFCRTTSWILLAHKTKTIYKYIITEQIWSSIYSVDSL